MTRAQECCCCCWEERWDSPAYFVCEAFSYWNLRLFRKICISRTRHLSCQNPLNLWFFSQATRRIAKIGSRGPVNQFNCIMLWEMTLKGYWRQGPVIVVNDRFAWSLTLLSGKRWNCSLLRQFLKKNSYVSYFCLCRTFKLLTERNWAILKSNVKVLTH